jgi:hypothetical protein
MTQASPIFLTEKEEEITSPTSIMICTMVMVIIVVVLLILIILARKNTREEMKKPAPPVKPPQQTLNIPPYHDKPIENQVVEGHKDEDQGLTPVDIGSEVDEEHSSPDYLVEEDDEFDITPGPVVEHHIDDEEVVEHIEDLKDRIEELKEDLPTEGYDDLPGSEPPGDLDDREMDGPLPASEREEPGSPSKPRMLEAPPGFEDE